MGVGPNAVNKAGLPKDARKDKKTTIYVFSIEIS